MEWERVCNVSDLRHSAADGIKVEDTQLAIFYVKGKGFFATGQMHPNKCALALSDGIIGADAETGGFSSLVLCRNLNISADKARGGGKGL